jgi:hypothetical protein
MRISIICYTQNKAIFARSTSSKLLAGQIYKIRAAASVNISCLLFMTASDSILLISLYILFKLASICGIAAIINTAKIEARAGLFQTTTRSNDGEALRYSPALEALLTEIWVLEDLAGDRTE